MSIFGDKKNRGRIYLFFIANSEKENALGTALTIKIVLVVSAVALTVFSCSTYFWVGSNFESRLLSFLVYAVLPLLGLYEAIRFYQGKSVGIGLIEALEKDPDKRRAILLVAHFQMALPILASF